MKFGKRRWEAKLAKDSSAAKTPPVDPVPESWRVPTDPAPEPPASVPPPSDEPATVVEGEAIELPITEVGGADEEPAVVEPEPEPQPVAYEPEPYAPEPRVSEPEPEPVADEPEPSTPAAVLSEPLPPPGAGWAPSPAPPPMPYPAAEEPVLVYQSGSESPAVTPLAETGEAYASGHATGMSPSWPEPVVALAAERPEVVVGAAFAGGLLFAMILRRLGS